MAYTKEEREFIERQKPITPDALFHVEPQLFGGSVPSLGEILEELQELHCLLEGLSDAYCQSMNDYDNKMYELLGYLQLHVDEEEED